MVASCTALKIVLVGAMRQRRHDRYLYRKSGVEWAVCSDGVASAAWKLSAFVLYV